MGVDLAADWQQARTNQLRVEMTRAGDALLTRVAELEASLAERDAEDIRRSEEGRTDWDYEQRIATLERRNAEFRIDAAHLRRQEAFSRETFGPGERLQGVLDHIRKELLEIEADPKDITEWADGVILVFDGALRQGHRPQDILDAIVAKQTRNEGRTWPDWRTADPNRAIEHVRAEADRG